LAAGAHGQLGAVVRARWVTFAEHDDPGTTLGSTRRGKSQKWAEVVEALTTDTPNESFTESVRLRRPHRRFQHPRADAARDAVELTPVLVVAISNDEARPHAERRGVA
jgi:hypothetical protein